MAELKDVSKAVFFVAITYSCKASFLNAIKELEKKFGKIWVESKEFDFTQFSKYYVPEMGKKQMKKYVVFRKLIDRSKLPNIRIWTQKLEKRLSKKSRKEKTLKRRVNIDPGYITTDAIVFATLKEKGHKIYLGKGVFADLQALFGRNELRTFDYTFRDLKANADFFLSVRRKLLAYREQRLNKTRK